RREEESFNRTLDAGISTFEMIADAKLKLVGAARSLAEIDEQHDVEASRRIYNVFRGANQMPGDRLILRKGLSQDEWAFFTSAEGTQSTPPTFWVMPADDILKLKQLASRILSRASEFPGSAAFLLYDEQGFPLDLTELMARERGLAVDVAGFEKLMDQQRERARKSQKKEEISVEEGELKAEPTQFLGYDFLETESVVDAVLPSKQAGEVNIVLDRTPFYAEMGGQVGDRGLLHVPGHDWTEVGQLRVIDTQKRGDVFVHRATLVEGRAPEPGEAVRISVDAERRNLIQG